VGGAITYRPFTFNLLVCGSEELTINGDETLTFVIDLGEETTRSFPNSFWTSSDSFCPVFDRILTTDNDGTDTPIPADLTSSIFLGGEDGDVLTLQSDDPLTLTFFVKGFTSGGVASYIEIDLTFACGETSQTITGPEGTITIPLLKSKTETFEEIFSATETVALFTTSQ